MTEHIRFHLDEHIPAAVADGLRARGIDVTTTPGAGLLGADDVAQLTYALGEKRVLVTNDHGFLRMHNQSVPHAGIAYCRHGSLTIGQIVRTLVVIYEIMAPDEIAGMVEYL